MPIYEFQCFDCERPFEELVLSSDEEVLCPNCDGSNIKRQLSAFSTGSGLSGSSSSGGCGCTPKTCGCH
jgi:putative FmdB family regulatory protein